MSPAIEMLLRFDWKVIGIRVAAAFLGYKQILASLKEDNSLFFQHIKEEESLDNKSKKKKILRLSRRTVAREKKKKLFFG